LIAATSGRSFWILDDISLIRQYKKDTGFTMFTPEDAFIINGSSELDRSSADFDGTNKFRGVNPSTGVVMYYHLPELKSTDIITMEIKDAEGNLVRSFSSKADSTYKRYDGGPPAEPTLSKSKGLNRFVWNMRCATMPGVPGVYIESSYRGHKVPPGKYSVTVKSGEQKQHTEITILPNPLYNAGAAAYKEFHLLMGNMEAEVVKMHRMVNSINAKREQLASILVSLPAGEKYNLIRKEADSLIKKMKAWDGDMVQRKSKAYDDVENFPNKFTANYMFLINQTESDIPQVNKPSLDLLKQLNAEWAILKIRADEITDKNLPALNKMLWDAGVGAVWKN
jgi:DNA-directed RNA polymerase subunit H (RpoH/RPB5)